MLTSPELLQAGSSYATCETGIWVIEDLATSRVLGNCGLTEKNIDGVDESELVYLLFASEWGKGYATEAALAVQNHAFSQ